MFVEVKESFGKIFIYKGWRKIVRILLKWFEKAKGEDCN